jgi:endonuclease G, mitochondrial
VPQPAVTNQKTWLAVEDYTTHQAAQLGPIHVIAGPVYPDLSKDNGAYLTLGKSRTVVPSSVFRILLRKERDGTWRAIAFLVPNDGSLERNPKVFATSVSAVEKSTGLTFFTGLPAGEAAVLKGNASLAKFER